MWLVRVKEGIRLLEWRKAAMQTAAGDQDQLSLIALPDAAKEVGIYNDRVVFVQWIYPEQLLGRLVHLDKEYGKYLLFSMAVHHRNKKNPNAQIVIPAVGIKMTRKRVPVSEDLISLKTMWELALRARHDHAECDDGVPADGGTFKQCEICKKNDQWCQQCALCLLVLHKHCGANAMGLAMGLDLPQLQDKLAVSALFSAESVDKSTGLCRCCQTFLAGQVGVSSSSDSIVSLPKRQRAKQPNFPTWLNFSNTLRR